MLAVMILVDRKLILVGSWSCLSLDLRKLAACLLQHSWSGITAASSAVASPVWPLAPLLLEVHLLWGRYSGSDKDGPIISGLPSS